MCDELTEKDNAKFIKNGGSFNRRDFGKLSVAASLAAMLPQAANAQSVTNQMSMFRWLMEVFLTLTLCARIVVHMRLLFTGRILKACDQRLKPWLNV